MMTDQEKYEMRALRAALEKLVKENVEAIIMAVKELELMKSRWQVTKLEAVEKAKSEEKR